MVLANCRNADASFKALLRQFCDVTLGRREARSPFSLIAETQSFQSYRKLLKCSPALTAGEILVWNYFASSHCFICLG